jgi:chromate reductase
MRTKKVAVLIGSLRKESYNRKIASNLIKLAPESLEMKVVEIGQLEIFNQDFEEDGATPQSWIDFRKKIKEFDAFLFVTPEYNRSVPAVLKNALDIGSRPYGENVWSGKPGAVVSVSHGALGGFGSNNHLRQTLMFLNVLTMAQPEVYLGNVDRYLDENGEINNDSTRNFLKSFIDAFAEWIEKLSQAY